LWCCERDDQPRTRAGAPPDEGGAQDDTAEAHERDPDRAASRRQHSRRLRRRRWIREAAEGVQAARRAVAVHVARTRLHIPQPQERTVRLARRASRHEPQDYSSRTCADEDERAAYVV